MTSGVFEVGELVEGVIQRTGLDEDTASTSPRISFRVAQLNHKESHTILQLKFSERIHIQTIHYLPHIHQHPQ